MKNEEVLRKCLQDCRIALVAEGGAERAIMDLLLDNDLLLFSRNDLIMGEVLEHKRKAKDLEEAIQGFDYGNEKMAVIRILDSKNENFRPTRWLKKQLLEEDGSLRIFDIVTSPEIEMLIIFAEHKYREYENFIKQKRGTKNTGKPSSFCKEILYKGKKVNFKSPNFYLDHFDSEKLIGSIHSYHQKIGSHSGFFDLSCLLKK